MFKGLGNMQSLMQQAQKMNQKITSLRAELDKREEEVSVGGGVVQVRVNGKLEVLSIQIDPSLIQDGDVAVIQDLVTSGVNAALSKIQKHVADSMSEITGGMQLPGMGF